MSGRLRGGTGRDLWGCGVHTPTYTGPYTDLRTLPPTLPPWCYTGTSPDVGRDTTRSTSLRKEDGGPVSGAYKGFRIRLFCRKTRRILVSSHGPPVDTYPQDTGDPKPLSIGPSDDSVPTPTGRGRKTPVTTEDEGSVVTRGQKGVGDRSSGARGRRRTANRGAER